MVEVIVMVSIASLSIFFIWNVYTTYVKISLSNPSLFQASFLAEEGVEAVKFMRDSGWAANIASLSAGTLYTLTFNGVSWGVSVNPLYIDGRFDRRISVEDVYRDGSGNIAPSGNLDPYTKKILSTVSWAEGTGTTTRQITTYVTNLFKN